MDTSEIVKIVDHAAGMNDRWLFLAAFCLLLIGCGAAMFSAAPGPADTTQSNFLLKKLHPNLHLKLHQTGICEAKKRHCVAVER